MEDKDRSEKNEEISLIDLVAVVLKHHRFVAISLGLTLLALIGGYFAYPAIRQDLIARESLSEGIMGLQVSALALELDETLPLRAASLLKDPALLLEALRRAGYERYFDIDLKDASRTRDLLRRVRDGLAEGKDWAGRPLSKETEPYLVEAADNDLRITFRDEDGDKVLAFLGAVAELTETRLYAQVLPSARVSVDAYEEFLSAKPANVEAVTELIGGLRLYRGAKALVDRKAPILDLARKPLLLSREVTRVELESEYLKLALLTFFAVTFAVLLLVFAIEAVDKIRRSPELAEKLAAVRATGRKGD